jgi:hypothetical protein
VSTNCYYRPVRRRTYPTVGCGLKWIFQKRYGSYFQQELDAQSIPWLTGIKDASSNDSELAKDAQTLIDAH